MTSRSFGNAREQANLAGGWGGRKGKRVRETETETDRQTDRQGGRRERGRDGRTVSVKVSKSNVFISAAQILSI